MKTKTIRFRCPRCFRPAEVPKGTRRVHCRCGVYMRKARR